jgi:hypothetical protein
MSISLFKNNPYYWETTRRLLTAIGATFSDITLIRSSDSGKEQVIRIPIDYGPKNKWLNRLNEDPDLANNVEIILPRIAFEITNYSYAANRKIGCRGEFILGRVGESTTKIYNPVPYDVTIQLHSMCKNQEDSLQILEQIVPYFAPNLTVNIDLLPQFGIMKNIPIAIAGIDVVDTYEGSREDFRTVIQTFTFVAQMDFFGPIITNNHVIKTAIADVTPYSEPQPPTALPGEEYTASVVPSSANKGDPHVVSETWLKEL